MSSLEMNKIVGAVLTAGVIAMASGFAGDMLMHAPELEEHAFVLAVAEDTGAEDGGADAAPSGPESILPLLAAADLAAGEKVAKKCAACHTFDEGGANKIGPNLWNTVGRAVAAVEGFGYSAALQGMTDVTWSYDELNLFLASPKNYAPGTKMSFAGLKKVGDRATLVAYLRSLSAAPVALPSAEDTQAAVPDSSEDAAAGEAEATANDAPAAEIQAAETQAAETEVAVVDAGGLGAQVAAATLEQGQKVARKCKACHSFEQGGPHKIGPNLYGVIDRGVGAAEGFKYSEALMGKSGETWSYANLVAYLESPKTWAPGNKMAFAGLRKEKDQAAILVFLREYHDSPPDLPQ